MLEFLHGLGYEACYLLGRIYAELVTFADPAKTRKKTAPKSSKAKNEKTYLKEKKAIAYYLGLIRSNFESFASGKENWSGSVEPPLAS